jgi:hypothetical protein
MLTQEIDCHKCGCSNKIGTIYCRNCGIKLKFSKAMLDTQKGKKVKKTIKRGIKAIIAIAIVTIIAMAFIPWGFPVPERLTNKDEIEAVINTCKEIDDMLAKKRAMASYEFTPIEITLAANFLSLEHEKAKKAQRAAMGFGTEGLGGTGKMGGSSMGGTTNKMEFEAKEDAKPAEASYDQKENARLRAWMERKRQDALNSGKVEVNPDFDFVITVKDNKTLCIVVQDIWLKVLPARFEICVVPTLKINKEEKTQILEYEITSARFGYLPVPLYLNDHIIELFEEMIMQERTWAKQYFNNIKNIEIVKGNINITIGK